MTSKKNQHVWEYLKYYLSLRHAPHFAVMLDGPWGIGKTFLVKRFLAEHFGEEGKDEYVYVSLFGLSTLEDLDDALLQATFPYLKTARVAQRVATTVLKRFGLDASGFDVKDFLDKFKAKVYVFDDLERFKGETSQALGYVNQFVEHAGAKVILIANEQEIDEGEHYRRRREKLIGKTLQVQSSFEEAFAYFASKIEDADARRFVESAASDITAIYEKSGLNNLRILQQTIWDFERVYKTMSAAHRQNADAMLTLLRLLFVLAFELKAARIGDDDILKGRGIPAAVAAQFAAKNNEKKPPMREVAERYAIDVDDDILSNETLVDVLIRGVVDPEAIATELNRSRFFVTVADEAPWRTVWHYTERTEDEFDRAFAKMEEQYAARQFTVEGEILHVLGLRLFLSDRGVVKQSRADVVTDGKRYIDDLYKAKTLKLEKPDSFSETRFDGFGGLGIHESKTPEYRELFAYLKQTRQRALEDTYPEKAVDLLGEMKRDVQEFYRQVCYSTGGDGSYAGIPVFARLDPDAFIDSLLALHPSEQHVVFMALKARYEHGRLDRELPEERVWLEAVRDKLLSRAALMKPMSGHRVEQHVSWYLKPVLGKDEPEPGEAEEGEAEAAESEKD